MIKLKKKKKAQGELQSLPQRFDALFLGKKVGTQQEVFTFFFFQYVIQVFYIVLKIIPC